MDTADKPRYVAEIRGLFYTKLNSRTASKCLQSLVSVQRSEQETTSPLVGEVKIDAFLRQSPSAYLLFNPELGLKAYEKGQCF